MWRRSDCSQFFFALAQHLAGSQRRDEQPAWIAIRKSLSRKFKICCHRFGLVGRSTVRVLLVRKRTKEYLLRILTSSKTTIRPIVNVAVFYCCADGQQRRSELSNCEHRFYVLFFSLLSKNFSHKLGFSIAADNYTLGQVVCSAIISAIVLLVDLEQKIWRTVRSQTCRDSWPPKINYSWDHSMRYGFFSGFLSHRIDIVSGRRRIRQRAN